MEAIEWGSKAERVAFHPPYVLLFDSHFIEIRHVQTGRLVQIIPGNDVRCIWDGRGVTGTPATTSDTPQGDGLETTSSWKGPKIYGAMNAEGPPAPGSRETHPTAQHLFMLVPIIPLCVEDTKARDI